MPTYARYAVSLVLEVDAETVADALSKAEKVVNIGESSAVVEFHIERLEPEG